MHGAPYPTINDLSVSKVGVEKVLKRLVTSKAPGSDGIPNWLSNELLKELAPVHASLFNQSITAGMVPDDWKPANISPIYKKDDKYTPANYRPVSLTCICLKIPEHTISHLMAHLETHSILTDLQHRFCQNRSCVSQLLLTVSDLMR